MKKLLKTCFTLFAALILIPGLSGQTINPLIPAFTGSQYTDTVPMTIDLAEMSRLALNGMTGPVDAEDNYSLYFTVTWNRNPAVLRHESGSDGCIAKFVAPLLLNRIITNETSSSITQTHANIIQHQFLDQVQDRIINASGSSTRVVEGLILHYLRDKNPAWKAFVMQAVRSYCENMTTVAIGSKEGGYWESDHQSDEFWGQDPWRDEILLLAYKVFGDKTALETVGKNVRYVLSNENGNQFNPTTGVFIDSPADANQYHNNHFHIHGLMLKVILQYALLLENGTEKTNLINFVKNSYAWAKSAAAGSNDIIGFFPEFCDAELDGYGNPIIKGEGCSVSDMVDLAILLSVNGIEDRWDDADKWIRNQFTEIQLTDEKGILLDNWSNSHEWEPVGSGETDENVTARAKGGFAGWFTPNQWEHQWRNGIQQCCTGNGCRTIFYVWDNMASYNELSGILTINLLMNRALKQAKIYSYIPYEGKVKIKMLKACNNVRLRMPDYVTNLTGVSCKVNGASRSIALVSHYIAAGSVNTDDEIIVNLPLPVTSPAAVLGNTTYTFTRKGNTVTNITPLGSETGTYLYNNRYQGSPAPTRQVNRFVSDESDILIKKDNHSRLNNENITVLSGNDTPANLLDEDFDSGWNTYGSWQAAELELDDSYKIAYIFVGIGDGEERFQKIEIQISADGASWNSVFNGQSAWNIRDLQAIDFPDTAGKYIKLIAKGNSENWQNSIHTLQVFVADSHEAEGARWNNAAVETEHSGYTGTGYVNVGNTTGSYVEWSVYMQQPATVQAVFRYANGAAAGRPVNIKVNGAAAVSNFSFAATGAWTTYRTATVTLVLIKGMNTIRLESAAASGGPNYDRLDLAASL